MFARRLLHKERRRLAALAAVLGCVQAEIRGIDRRAGRPHELLEAGLDSLHFGGRDQAASHARLIADHDQLPAFGGKFPQGFGGAWEQSNLLRIARVFTILDDGAVAVEE